MTELLQKAKEIAQNYDVATVRDGAVVYSISFMPNDNNKQEAYAYLKAHPFAKMLDDTPCGRALIELGLNGKVNEVAAEITSIWKQASSRYIKAASGNIRAFVTGADERSTFCTTELKEILQNPCLTHINGIEKNVFVASFKPKKY